jgi:hypothetical protein
MYGVLVGVGGGWLLMVVSELRKEEKTNKKKGKQLINSVL